MLTRWQARGRMAVLVAAVVLLPVQVSLLSARHDLVVGVALVVATAHVLSAPLALWRPVLAAVLSLVAFTAQAALIMPQGVAGWPWAIPPQVITQLLVLLVLTAVLGWRFAAGALIVQLAVGVILALVGMAWNDLTASLGYVVLFAGLALLIGSLGAVGARLLETGEVLQRERRISAEEHSRRTVVEEKSRIARELHDVIAHNMSLITVQARSAPDRVGDVSDAAGAEFDEIADRAAEALRQMRGVLDVLRTESGQSGRVPVPGLTDLDELFESARATGQQIDVDGSLPAPDQVATDVGAAAYRIVQEALSNARRHATASPVQVQLSFAESGFVIRIANALDGRVEVGSEGHGVIGMRERASVVGGSVTVDAAADDEFVIVAQLPLRPAGDRDEVGA